MVSRCENGSPDRSVPATRWISGGIWSLSSAANRGRGCLFPPMALTQLPTSAFATRTGSASPYALFRTLVFPSDRTDNSSGCW